MSCSISSAPPVKGNSLAGRNPDPQPTVVGFAFFHDSGGVLPDDFPERLDRLRRACNFTWNGLADALGVDRKQVLRWKDGTEPCGGAMLSIIRLAAVVSGGLDIIMGEGFLASLWRP